MRVAVLFSRLSGYMSTCLKELKNRNESRLMVVFRPPSSDAPFDISRFSWIDTLYDRSRLKPSDITRYVLDFHPDVIFMSGWVDEAYLKTARVARKKGIPVIAGSDAQWTGSLRQQAARLVSKTYLHSAIDVLWVAGERQRQFAERLGFSGDRCWSGVYACDWPRFAAEYERRETVATNDTFLFVGRYVKAKGLPVLVRAYRKYRSMVSDPWPLHCVGTGPDAALLQEKGIIDRGFVQPEHLPDIMGQASAFVLPSLHEPWGVVAQEAAATGLPLICPDACGAAVHLLQDGYNGYLFGTGDASHLAHQLVRLTRLSVEERAQMGERSFELSRQFTPERWAATFVDGLEALRGKGC